MTIYAKKLSREWKEAFRRYEQISGFEPMFQEDVDSGEITPREAWNRNICWLEDVLAETTNIKIPFEE